MNPTLSHSPSHSAATPAGSGASEPPLDPARRWQQVIATLRAGRPVILLDDADRENEADLIVAAELIDEATMALLIRECSGIVCLCLEDDAVRRLQLPPMVAVNGSRHGTAFTVSIEAREGVSTGVSAADRVTTVRAALAGGPGRLVSPGHVFPLRAAPGGLRARRGHTEGSVELCRLAGLQPAAVLCELMNPDGTMMRGAQVAQFARTHGLPVLSIDEVAALLVPPCGDRALPG